MKIIEPTQPTRRKRRRKPIIQKIIDRELTRKLSKKNAEMSAWVFLPILTKYRKLQHVVEDHETYYLRGNIVDIYDSRDNIVDSYKFFVVNSTIWVRMNTREESPY